MWRALCFAGVLLALAGCGSEGGRQEITVTRSGSVDTGAPAGSSNTAARLGMRAAGGGGMGGMGMGMGSAATQYAYDTPEGWEEAPATSMRQVNFTVGEEGECYLTVLSGTRAGLAANVNRWRRQMGLGPLNEEAVAELPATTLLGHDAVAIDLAGAFSGMGTEAQEGYRMLGRLAVTENEAYSVKLTGPEALVAEQMEAFDQFCDSLEEDPMTAAAAAHAAAGLPAMPSGMPGSGMGGGMQNMPAVGGFNTMNLDWDAPESWEQAPDRPMRLVTYTVGEAECYVAVLSGPAGGVEANVNFWRQQMGQPPLPKVELAALPKLTVLGQESPMVEIKGEYTGMGERRDPGYAMLGVICPLDGQTLFVKMVGPEATLAEHTDEFQAFCTSLRQAS